MQTSLTKLLNHLFAVKKLGMMVCAVKLENVGITWNLVVVLFTNMKLSS